jgi:hypothetical protein
MGILRNSIEVKILFANHILYTNMTYYRISSSYNTIQSFLSCVNKKLSLDDIVSYHLEYNGSIL